MPIQVRQLIRPNIPLTTARATQTKARLLIAATINHQKQAKLPTQTMQTLATPGPLPATTVADHTLRTAILHTPMVTLTAIPMATTVIPTDLA